MAETTGRIKNGSLYLVLSSEYAGNRSVLDIALHAVSGGIDILQMREKSMERDELRRLGGELSALCRGKGVLFIVNDDPVLAEELDADGVHLGQEDRVAFPVADVRQLLGPGKVIGLSTHDPDQFREANDMDLDYIAYGPIFPTKTKPYCIGTKDVRTVLRRASKPVVLIGGIDRSNLKLLLSEGARNIALIRDLMQAGDIEARAGWYKRQLENALKGNNMEIRINGAVESVPDRTSLGELVRLKGLIPERVVIELNLEIVAREKWSGTLVRAGDRVEIVSFVGGG